MSAELASVIDYIRHAASRFAAAGLCLGHGHDSAVDEAAHLVLSALHLPPDLPPAYAAGKLTLAERVRVQGLIDRRIGERVPVAYLVGEAWFAGLCFASDARALVPRSPIAELITEGFSPWLDGCQVQRVLDLCTGSGCIGLAMAVHQPDWQVDLADISADALALAAENRALHGLDEPRVRLIRSDLFDALDSTRYDLIVSNPPYVSQAECDALPAEFGHEPRLGLVSGVDGMDLVLRMLAQAPDHLAEDGVLVVEVGASEPALLALLPDVPFTWIEFSTGPMGVFAISRADLVEHAAAITALAGQRAAGGGA